VAASFQGFRSLIENSPDAISLMYTDGEIPYGSASYHQDFRIPAGRASGSELLGADSSRRS
jgi:hypothetical protein